jgi:chromosome segregation ATPase
LATERDEQQRTAEQAFVVIESLTQQRDLYLTQRNEVNHVRVEQQAQLDAFEKAIAESQAQLGISSQAQVVLQSEIETLTQQRDLYLTQRDEFNHVRVEQQTQLEVLSQEIQSVKAEKNNLHDMHQDLIVRIRLMEDEISRTEGQIELIKDLMLSDGRTT